MSDTRPFGGRWCGDRKALIHRFGRRGLFDLEDQKYVRFENLITTLDGADYMQGGHLVVPYCTDVVVAHK